MKAHVSNNFSTMEEKNIVDNKVRFIDIGLKKTPHSLALIMPLLKWILFFPKLT